jgi:hypothetical protein
VGGEMFKVYSMNFVALPTCGMKKKQMEKPFMVNNCQFYCIETLQQPRGNEMKNASTLDPSNYL